MEAAEWAERKVEQEQARINAQVLRSEVFLRQQRLAEANFPELVRAVVKDFESCCEEYNKRCLPTERSLHFYHVGHNSHLLKRDAGWSEMSVTADPSALLMQVRANNCDFRFDLIYRTETLADGSVMFRTGRSLASPDDVAQRALDAFLSGRELGDRL